MNITLNAYRINKIETTVFLSFSNIIENEFKLYETTIIKNSKNEYGVVFHIKNHTKGRIELGGNYKVSFKADFLIETNQISVFYWNDEDLLTNNIKCFQDFFEENGLDPNVREDLGCDKQQHFIPRQSGNGGVIGIVDLP